VNARRTPVWAVCGLLTCALALASPGAHALTKDQCVDANTRAQSLRREGKLGAAREQLTLCMDATCPGIVRDDCTQRLDELERVQPTIVFDAKSAVGDDVVLVHVAVDGLRLADVLDGRSLGVDPGQHVFTFDVPGQPTTTYRFVLKEGEKDRRERIVLAGPPQPVPASSAASTATTAGPSRGQRQRIAGVVLGAVGLAGLGVGAVFGGLALHDWSDSKSECDSAHCSNGSYGLAVSDHDRAVTASTIATVGFISGGVLLATGLAVWLTSPSSTDAESSAGATSARLSPVVAPGLAGFSVTGRF
jgi:hypothetical protein